MIAEIVVMLGAVLILLASIGVVRFDDTLARTHALTKATSFGIALVLVGAAFRVDRAGDAAALVLTAVLQMLTTPVSGHLIGRAVYRSRYIPARLDVVDELGGAGHARTGQPPSER
jgi:multicomponent Na+:H+ antiporter subunit G